MIGSNRIRSTLLVLMRDSVIRLLGTRVCESSVSRGGGS